MLRVLAPGIEPDDSYRLLTSAAVASGDEEVCRFLIEHGVNINSHNDELPFRKPINTPLHHAGQPHPCVSCRVRVVSCAVMRVHVVAA